MQAINPLDGRYYEKTRALAPYFSEQALMKYRVMVECQYLLSLSLLGKTSLKKFSQREIKLLEDLYEKFDDISYTKIKDFEKVTNHDVKAVEYFIKEELKGTTLKSSLEWVHFALTSEDTNNVAYALILSNSIENVMIPEVERIIIILKMFTTKYSDLPMLSRTHGQSATPTTFGKEMKVFQVRLEKQISKLKSIKIEAKLNGATGNWSAHTSAYPKVDWMKFSNNFINQFNKVGSNSRIIKLVNNSYTTQIETHDSYIEVFDTLKRVNSILLDFSQDMWRYISDNWIIQIPKSGEVGSSTMPHKINPIDFENSEGNLGIANALFEFFARKLPISRLQRDLSDSTVERAFGTAFGHSYLGYTSLLKGLSKISINENKIKEDLLDHSEVVAEAIQTVLRSLDYPIPYEALKELTRGKKVTMDDFQIFIDNLKVSSKVKSELKKFTPLTYTGLASKIAKK